jgi:hypothetical protein
MTDQTTRRSLRSAIYTRVSTDQGLEQDFNSLDAQREASQQRLGDYLGAARTKRTHQSSDALLAGKLYDDGGNRMSPSWARKGASCSAAVSRHGFRFRLLSLSGRSRRALGSTWPNTDLPSSGRSPAACRRSNGPT